MSYTLQIQKLLLKIELASHNKDRIQLQKQAISIADSNGDLEWGFELREDLLYFEKGTSQSRESFPAFAWMLNAVENNPDLLDIDALLQKYRWMVLASYKKSDLSLEQIESISSDYKRRMQERGHGLYSYYNILCQLHILFTDTEKAKEYQSLRENEQPDNISFCKACEINTDVELNLLSSDFDKAISLSEEVISGRSSCYYEPLSILSKLCYYLAINKDNKAENYYEKSIEAYSEIKEYESRLLPDLCRLIFYSSQYDTKQAWIFFEKASEWEIDADDYPSFYFAVNVLPLLKKKQIVQLNLNSNLPFWNTENSYNTETLYQHYLKRAENLASIFDSRNKTNYCSQLLDTILKYNCK